MVTEIHLPTITEQMIAIITTIITITTITVITATITDRVML